MICDVMCVIGDVVPPRHSTPHHITHITSQDFIDFLRDFKQILKDFIDLLKDFIDFLKDLLDS